MWFQFFIYFSFRLCHAFKAGASGFVEIRNIVDESVSEKQLYQITRKSAERCFVFRASKSSKQLFQCIFLLMRCTFINIPPMKYVKWEKSNLQATCSAFLQHWFIQISSCSSEIVHSVTAYWAGILLGFCFAHQNINVLAITLWNDDVTWKLAFCVCMLQTCWIIPSISYSTYLKLSSVFSSNY